MVVIKLPFRDTIRTGAITRCDVFRQSDGLLLVPVYKQRSRTGAHGLDVYDVPESFFPLIVVEYRRSNSGREYIRVYRLSSDLSESPVDPSTYGFIEMHLDDYYPNWRYFQHL